MMKNNKGVQKTLSGGERKRLALATEILTDPKLLFCDEPTSGLDFATARRVIMSLENLSKRKESTYYTKISTCDWFVIR